MEKIFFFHIYAKLTTYNNNCGTCTSQCKIEELIFCNDLCKVRNNFVSVTYFIVLDFTPLTRIYVRLILNMIYETHKLRELTYLRKQVDNIHIN